VQAGRLLGFLEVIELALAAPATLYERL